MCLCVGTVDVASAHEGPDTTQTHTFSVPRSRRTSPWLALAIVDDESGQPLPARFQLQVEGDNYTPPGLGDRGVRVEVRHAKKGQRAVFLYSRGEGTVIVPLPGAATSGTVTVSHGTEYQPVEQDFDLHRRAEARVTIRLRRWIDLPSRGWHAADAHLHFDRLSAERDVDWLTMLAADGVAHGHFLSLKGGNLPGLWARQYTHGRAGMAHARDRWIRPGTEYRDRMQGHISLLGPTQLILPVATGGLGEPPVDENFPPLHDVMQHARELGGLAGIAHGNALGRQPTGLLDAVLGATDFVEIANTHRVELDAWYQLLNCGIMLPPAAGTDLPNNPFRDPWQPLLGETRMYVKSDTPPDFDAWKAAVRVGAVVVSSGPWLELDVAGVGPGGTVHLPAEGGYVRVSVVLQSPRIPHAVEVVHDGQALQGRVRKTREADVHTWRLTHKLHITRSGWLAARGYGARKRALHEHTGIRQREVAHTAAVRVLVGEQPVFSQASGQQLSAELARLREAYRSKGTYARPQDLDHVLHRFDEAQAVLQDQLNRSRPTPPQR